MAEVLVLVDHVDGAVRKTTLELLTIAARLGEPSAVFLGDGLEQARSVLGEYGAGTVYTVGTAELGDYLVAPKAVWRSRPVRASSPMPSMSRRAPPVRSRPSRSSPGPTPCSRS
jgi:electron transfer flavoprotein alpha subunit